MNTATPQQAGEKLIRLLAVTLVISVMSATMFNIVLPEIRYEFHLSFAQVSWVSVSYMLIYAIGSVTYGKLADTYRLKSLLTFGLAAFALGSMIGLLAQAFWMVLAGRILQAVGASVIPATGMIIPIRYFPPESRGRALGISATGLALGGALAPIVAAFVVSFVHWRWLFCIPLLTLMTLPYYRKYLDDERGQESRLDWLGGGLLAGTVGLLLLAVTNGNWLLAAGGMIVLALFLVRIHHTAEPFVQPKLFQNKSYTLMLVLAFFASGIGYSLPFLSPQMLSHLNQLAPGGVGFVMVPAAIGSAILGRTGGKLADSKGNAFLFFTASALLFTCFVLLSTFAGFSPALIAVFLIFGNVGQTFMLIALSNTTSRLLPKEQVGVGMGMMSLLNFIAVAVFASVYSKVVDLGEAGGNVNAATSAGEAGIYSSIYFVLACLYIAMVSISYTLTKQKARDGMYKDGPEQRSPQARESSTSEK
ncbi:MFS transporter [Brevibacillus borstelensis]|uniref:MFS transporter n=1 Tax=Brevibacillus borstelensis TaxID=45462 RepID=UPI003CC91E59